MSMVDYFNNMADKWDDISKVNLDYADYVMSVADINEGDLVLDIACGTGVMTKHIHYRGCIVTGVDISSEMIKKARESMSDCSNVEFLCDDVMNIKGVYDKVLQYNSYPHFFDKNALVEKIASLIAPGGRYTVIHNMGYKRINLRHNRIPDGLSVPLKSAKEEALVWRKYFDVDKIVDLESHYSISGTRKSNV